MSILEPSPSPWTGRALSVLRVVAGFLFISFGTMKLFAVPAGPMPGTVKLLSELGLAGVLETFGGLAILVGFLTRPVAFLLSGEMAVAYFQGHSRTSFWPSVNGGTAAVLYCFLYLYLTFAGAGPWSVDAWIARSRTSRTAAR